MIRFLLSTLPMFVCGFWSVFFILEWFGNREMRTWRLSVFMAVCMLLYACHFVFFEQVSRLVPVTDSLYSFCNPAVFPLFYIYVKEQTDASRQKRPAWCYLIPSFLCFIAVSITYALMSAEEVELFVDDYLYCGDFSSLHGLAYVQFLFHVLVKFVFAAQIVPILVSGIRRIRNFESQLAANYSELDGKTMRPITLLLGLFVVVSLISFLCNIIGRERFFDSIWMLSVSSLSFSFLLYMVGYAAYRQHFSAAMMESEGMGTADDFTAEVPPAFPSVFCGRSGAASDGFSATGLDAEQEKAELDDKMDLLKEQIQQLMVEEKFYLRPNLKILDVSQRLGTNRSYIYNAINGGMGISFSDYVNRLRIDYAVSLMKTDKDLLLSEISTKAGFASTVSFYRNFKHFMGCSPKSFRDRL